MLWKCDECTTLYAVDAPRCPHCGATSHAEVDSGGEPVGPKFPPDDVKAAAPDEAATKPAKATPKAPAGA